MKKEVCLTPVRFADFATTYPYEGPFCFFESSLTTEKERKLMDREKLAGLEKKVPDMVEYGIRAFHEMKEVKKVLQEVDGMLGDVLDRKREGHLASVHVILKRLWVRAGQEKKEAAGKFAYALEEYLRYRRTGIRLAQSIIRSALLGAEQYGHEGAVPRTPSAMRLNHFKHAAAIISSEERLAA